MRKKSLIIILSIIASLALIVVLSSIIFSVNPDNVTAYCYNSQDEELEQQVLSSAEIKRQSIFFMSEKKLTDQIEKAVNADSARIEIINIERIFPNRLSINFVKIQEFFSVKFGEQYAVCDNKGRVIELRPNASPLTLIEVRLSGTVVSPAAGRQLTTAKEWEVPTIASVLDALDRLDYRKYRTINLVESIDITNPEQVILKLRTSGVTIKIFGTARLDEKMQSAISCYLYDDPSTKTGGTITTVSGPNSKIKSTYLASGQGA